MRWPCMALVFAGIFAARPVAAQCWPGTDWSYWHGCVGDVNGDGPVDLADLAQVLADFGTTALASDIDGSGVVDTADLAVVLAELGSSADQCGWPPARHAVLRVDRTQQGAELWLESPPDLPGGQYGISGIQAWLVTSPGTNGTITSDPNTVWVELCEPQFRDGRIGFAFGAAPGNAWGGTVHLGTITGSLGGYVVLYRPAAPPARCSENTEQGVKALRFTVMDVESQ